MAAVLCIDFDDTLVTGNTMRALLERFAAPGWRELESAYHAGTMSVEQYNSAAFSTVEASREELRTAAEEASELRPGAVELLDWANWHGWHAVVLSNGFDLYIDPVLKSLRPLQMARHSGRAVKGYRWSVRYFSPRGIEVQERFKLAYVRAFQEAGDFVAYIGDGQSDIEAASHAQAVFARSTLLEALKADHPRIYPFETLHDVRQVLDREAESWLASFSSTTAAADL